MNQFFQSYFGMALGAGIVILVVLAVRPLIKKFSHRVACLLWLVVLFRLLCPVTIEGPLPAFWSGKSPSQAAVSEAERDTGISRAASSGSSASGELRTADNGRNPEPGVSGLEAETSHSREDAWNVGQIQEMKNGQDAEKTQEGKIAQSTGEPRDVRDVKNTDVAQGLEETLAADGQGVQGKMEQEEAQKPVSADGRENDQDIYGETAWDAGAAASDQSVQKGSGVKGWLATLYQRGNAWSNSLVGKCVTNVCGVIWLFGAVLLLLYGIWNYHTLRQRLQESVPLRTWEKYPVRISDVAGVPMSFGVLRRGIFVPKSFRAGTKEQEIILLHEATHLRRMDPLWKLLALLGLCVHWWNPLIWLCISLFNKDIEMACDEGVLSRMGEENRGVYANALLHFAKHRSGLSMAAAFGESNAESRIKEVLSYKKRSIGATIAMVCLVAFLGGCLATKPATDKEETKAPDVMLSGVAQTGEKQQAPGVITEITELQEAISVDLPFRNVTRQRTAPANVPYFGYDEGYYDIYYLDELTESWKAEAPEKYEALSDPATSLETLIPLKGGSSEAFWDSASDALVIYTFANGEKAHYFMAQRGEAWYPYLLAEQSNEFANEESKKALDARLDQIVRQKEELSGVTAAELRGVTLRAEDIEYGRNFQPISEEEPYAYRCWDPGELGAFCILQEIPEEDVCLYGLYDGRAMALRIGNQAYPIRDDWTNLRSMLPELHAGDYDHDGKTEFALITLEKTGTGTSGNRLRVIEVTKDGLEFYEPKSQGMYGQLEKMVSYRYDEKSLMLSVETTDGDLTYASLESIPALASGEEKFQWLSYGMIEGFSVMDDYLFYDVSSGIQITNKEEPEFGGIDLSCKLEYHEDGSFSVGRIRPEPAWTEPVDKTDLTAGFAGEEILLKTRVELTHDGVPDWIVSSVTYQEENRLLSWERRMAQGEICVVRVYDGARQQSAWEKGSIPEGSFGRENIYREQTFADAHAGNGALILCEKDGRNYLLTVSAGMWQGIMTAEYEVIAMDELGREYVIDSEKASTDINDLASEFSVDGLIEFTEKLNEWTKRGRLIAMTDVSLGMRLSVGTLGQTALNGQTYAVTFDAWEIWSALADSINQEIFAAQISSISPINVTYEYVACTGMENLRESLTSLQKRFEQYVN